MRIEVKAAFDGEVELLVRAGQRLFAGQGLVVVEGRGELVRIAAMKPGSVARLNVRDGQAVREGDVLMVVDEDPVPTE